ncbi:MAG: protease modulator HflC [Steroidobacteraceae bacterium]|jgi:membrane protease subunit HflC|nr:protease modulator HflC [Steroidobacteraceae bacterium]MCC7199576.1 protease modulator HflC [Gammaproteobacteria bacterium]
MNNKILAILAGVVFGVVVLANSVFTVKETEYAVKFEFGRIISADFGPGLHAMVPFYQNVRKFERRVLTRNYPAESFLTSEGKILNVDFYVKWRVEDPGTFYTSTGGDEDVASGRLAEIVKDGLKGVFAKRTIQQVVAAERREFIGDIMQFAGKSVAQLGLTLVDVRVKRIDLPEDVSDSVYNRMRQDFARQAAQLRAEGDEAAQLIRAEAERTRTEILANAARDANKIRGEGDAEAAKVYAGAYQRNPEFYAFYRSMQAYRNSLGQPGDLMVIAPEGEFFKYMKQSQR